MLLPRWPSPFFLQSYKAWLTWLTGKMKTEEQQEGQAQQGQRQLQQEGQQQQQLLLLLLLLLQEEQELTMGKLATLAAQLDRAMDERDAARAERDRQTVRADIAEAKLAAQGGPRSPEAAAEEAGASEP